MLHVFLESNLIILYSAFNTETPWIVLTWFSLNNRWCDACLANGDDTNWTKVQLSVIFVD